MVFRETSQGSKPVAAPLATLTHNTAALVHLIDSLILQPVFIAGASTDSALYRNDVGLFYGALMCLVTDLEHGIAFIFFILRVFFIAFVAVFFDESSFDGLTFLVFLVLTNYIGATVNFYEFSYFF